MSATAAQVSARGQTIFWTDRRKDVAAAGGAAAAAKMTPEQRSARARKAVAARRDRQKPD